MRLAITAHLDYRLRRPADCLLAVEVAPMADQVLVWDRLSVTGVGPLSPVAALEGVGRRTWMHAETQLTADYQAVVDINRAAVMLDGLSVDPLASLPPSVVPYLFPSRYCDSDRFESAVLREFGHLSGGDKVRAIATWIRGHLDYAPGVSASTTTASDTFVAHHGVCRDFAHLLIAMVRAADIPARMVGAYGLGVTPQDFHAVAEVWLAGAWHLVDATDMAPTDALVRLGVGRDATDIAFLTVFGHADFVAQYVTVTRLEDEPA
jgi:transglutaminase-like putative cysteine protease